MDLIGKSRRSYHCYILVRNWKANGRSRETSYWNRYPKNLKQLFIFFFLNNKGKIEDPLRRSQIPPGYFQINVKRTPNCCLIEKRRYIGGSRWVAFFIGRSYNQLSRITDLLSFFLVIFAGCVARFLPLWIIPPLILSPSFWFHHLTVLQMLVIDAVIESEMSTIGDFELTANSTSISIEFPFDWGCVCGGGARGQISTWLFTSIPISFSWKRSIV